MKSTFNSKQEREVRKQLPDEPTYRLSYDEVQRILLKELCVTKLNFKHGNYMSLVNSENGSYEAYLVDDKIIPPDSEMRMFVAPTIDENGIDTHLTIEEYDVPDEKITIELSENFDEDDGTIDADDIVSIILSDDCADDDAEADDDPLDECTVTIHLENEATDERN